MIRFRPSSNRRYARATTWSTLLISVFMLCGCGQVVQVKRAKMPIPPASGLDACLKSGNNSGCKLPGVPFYGVGYRCVHTTVWVQPIYAISVSVKDSDGNVHQLDSKTFTLAGFRDKRLQQFLVAAALPISSDTDEKDLEGMWKQLSDVSANDPYEIDEDTIGQSDRVYLYSNNIAAERYVDTTSVMFLNTSKPLAGSATATTTLNSDGTLGSGSAQEESKTLATLTALIPTSTLAQSLPPALGMAARPSGGQSKTYTVQITTKTDFYKHTHSAPIADLPPCGVPQGKNDVVISPSNVTVEHVGDLPPPTPAPASDTPAAKKP
jgi:hypothetical protein